MKLVRLQCPNCGAKIEVNENAEKAVCEYCGTVVPVEREKAKVTVKHGKFGRKAFVIFGAIAAVVIAAAVGIILSVTGRKVTAPNVYKKAGVYLVGEDIPAGEYVLYPDVRKEDGDVTPVLEVRKTKDAAADASDFLYRKEFYMRQYVNLNDGEYIAFDHALMYLPEKAALKKLDKSGYSAAQLKVGADIPAGEYVIVGEKKQTQYYITSKPEAQIASAAALNSPDMLSFGYCENRIYVKVNDGEYLTFAGGRLYKPGEAPALSETADGKLPAGQYKVGTDIAAGRYRVYPVESKKDEAWVCLNKNAVNTGRIDPWKTDIIAAGGETLYFIRLEDHETAVDIEIPDTSDEMYITFWFGLAEKI